MNSFESYSETSAENIETTALRKGIRARLRRAIQLGLAGLALALPAELIREARAGESAYQEYLSQALSPEERGRYDSLRASLEAQVGAKSIRRMEDGDRRAFHRRSEAPQPVTLGDRDEAGALGRRVEAIVREESGVFPKRWISGEIAQIRFSDDREPVDNPKGAALTTGASYTSNGEITIYTPDRPIENLNMLNSADQRDLIFRFKNLLGHETGHGNDWGSDKDLNLLERAELLRAVIDRMGSPDAFRNEVIDGKAYHELYNDGSQKGLHQSATEYWADICQEFFSNPQNLQTSHPEDFKLVSRYVAKNDPSYDVFAVNRYSTRTTAEGKTLYFQQWELAPEEREN